MILLNNQKLFYFATCALAGILVMISNGEGTKVATVRSLVGAPETIPKPIDDRPICGGPRRRASNIGDTPIPDPLYKKAIYGLQLGPQRPYGKLNNMILELFTGVDVAQDSGGRTVVIVSRWAHAWMMQFFPDGESWERLAHDLPIVREHPDLKLQPLQQWSTRDFLTREPASFKEQQSWEVVHARRVNFFHYLFSNLQGEPCEFLSKIEDHLKKKFNQTKYVAVHVRNMEGKCALHNKGQYAKEQCEMTPEYIQGIMDSAGLKLPIVILSDMQDEAKIHKIQDELDQVVVPEWDFGADPSMTADLVVATMGEIFIGQEGSSGSRNIGIIREAFGKDLSTNYVFVNKTAEGKWTTFVRRQ